MIPPLIGISGYGRSGKDTLGAMIRSIHGHERVSFADSLKELLAYTLFGERNDRLIEVAKSLHREQLQRLGDECRRLFGEDCWIRAADLNRGGKLVVTDVRYRNEADIIKYLGGEVWRITRPGFGPVNGHVSETELDDWPFDRVIVNGSDLPALLDQVMELGSTDT